MAVPLIVVLWRMGFLPGADLWIERAVAQLRHRRDQFVRLGPASEPAAVARTIGTSVPLVHGGGAVGAAASQRWKTQVNENVKRLAFCSTQPELCHNEVCGWSDSSKEIAGLMSLVMLRHDSEHPQVGRRFEIAADSRAAVGGQCRRGARPGRRRAGSIARPHLLWGLRLIMDGRRRRDRPGTDRGPDVDEAPARGPERAPGTM